MAWVMLFWNLHLTADMEGVHEIGKKFSFFDVVVMRIPTIVWSAQTQEIC